MDLLINHNEPTTMHIDLNSCFATIEQQANPLLRGKPIAVAAYTSPNGCVLAPSYEAKSFGVKTGMTVRDAKLLCKEIIILAPDPPKYRDVHLKFKNLFKDYSPLVTPKSIDEAVIDFSGTQALKRGLVEIGKEIKYRMKKEIGEWLLCNVGIGTNRFLAKLAASLHKPDGLDKITHGNLKEIYASRTLKDLCGINTRYEARLNTAGIFTPLDFLNAPLQKLKMQVFQSINGYYWYLRLRGWEIDAVDFSRKSYGQSYALKNHTDNKEELSKLLMKLVEKMGRRMRGAGYSAHGIHVSCLYVDNTHWHQSTLVHSPMYSSYDLFLKAQLVLNRQPVWKKVSNLAVSCYELVKDNSDQLELFGSGEQKRKQLSQALDKINDRYGEYVITPALMMGMDDTILDRVSFGGVKELEDLYR